MSILCHFIIIGHHEHLLRELLKGLVLNRWWWLEVGQLRGQVNLLELWWLFLFLLYLWFGFLLLFLFLFLFRRLLLVFLLGRLRLLRWRLSPQDLDHVRLRAARLLRLLLGLFLSRFLFSLLFLGSFLHLVLRDGQYGRWRGCQGLGASLAGRGTSSVRLLVRLVAQAGLLARLARLSAYPLGLVFQCIL